MSVWVTVRVRDVILEFQMLAIVSCCKVVRVLLCHVPVIISVQHMTVMLR